MLNAAEKEKKVENISEGGPETGGEEDLICEISLLRGKRGGGGKGVSGPETAAGKGEHLGRGGGGEMSLFPGEKGYRGLGSPTCAEGRVKKRQSPLDGERLWVNRDQSGRMSEGERQVGNSSKTPRRKLKLVALSRKGKKPAMGEEGDVV